MRNSLICLICSFWLVNGVQAAPLFCGEFRQGEIIRGFAPDTREIELNGKKFAVTGDGRFLLALGRDEQAKINVVFHGNGFENIYSFDVTPVAWDIQRVKGVPQRKVTPTAEDEAEILREQKDVRAALSVVDTSREDWQNGFIVPVEGSISGHFGNQRFFNGVPKNPHSGTDIAAPEGTPVKASSSGRVLLAGGNYFYGGNMVIIDHGAGLQTIYMHLKEAKVKQGDEVKQGDIIGLVGKTGRVTGPHLHWGASLNNIRFRPHALLELINMQCTPFKKEN